jgi:hypothetical protein
MDLNTYFEKATDSDAVKWLEDKSTWLPPFFAFTLAFIYCACIVISFIPYRLSRFVLIPERMQ